MRILVVSDKNGTAKVKPFNDNKNHAGEAYWIHGKTFKVSTDNRIKFGKKFMEQYGHMRNDGRRAFVMETGTKWLSTANLPKGALEKYGIKKKTKDNRYFVRGANILKGEAFEKYYGGHTGEHIPVDEVEYGDNGAIKLRPENTVDVYGD
jgi:hypothetical protein